VADILTMNGPANKVATGHEPSQGWGLLEERGPNGELLARHVHGPSVDELVLSELNGVVYYYHHDHLNSTIAVTDESANVVEQYRYDVYGQPYFYGPDGTPRAESALGLRFLFTGREWRSSLALYDYRHRAYSPSLGRFLQTDPLGCAAGDTNLYRYLSNGTGLGRDPLGLCEEKSSSYVTDFEEPLHAPARIPVGRRAGPPDGVRVWTKEEFRAEIEKIHERLRNPTEADRVALRQGTWIPGLRPLDVLQQQFDHRPFRNVRYHQFGENVYRGDDVNYVAQGMFDAFHRPGSSAIRMHLWKAVKCHERVREPTMQFYRLGRSYLEGRGRFERQLEELFR
jgi:RHS repeat-associated protein